MSTDSGVEKPNSAGLWDDKFLGVMKLAEAYRKLTAEPAAAAKREALSRIQNAWQKIAGFATCDSSPGGDYRVTIKYPTLAKAQDAYSAIHNISKVLTEQLDPSTYSNATAVDLESGTFDFEPSPSEAERERIRYEYDDDRKSITKRYPSGQTENIGKGEAAAELDELQAELEAVKAERDDAIKERDARGQILDEIQEATGSTWWHGAVDWASKAFEFSPKADSTEDYKSKLTREHVPGYIRQLLTEKTRLVVAAKRSIAEAQTQLAAVEAERDGWKRQHDMILSQAQKDNLRAEDADRYELWLLEIGKLSGCGHVDDNIVRCIEQEFEKIAAERDEYRRKYIAAEQAATVAVQAQEIIRLTLQLQISGAEAMLDAIERAIPRNEAHRDYAETVQLFVEEAAVAAARKQHGASGMCCALREQEKRRADDLQAQLDRELTEALSLNNEMKALHDEACDERDALRAELTALREAAEGAKALGEKCLSLTSKIYGTKKDMSFGEFSEITDDFESAAVELARHVTAALTPAADGDKSQVSSS